MRFSQEQVVKFTAGSVVWGIRTLLLAIASYALSAALYNPDYIDSMDWTIFKGTSPRIRKMTRLWPPFNLHYLWALNAAALMLIFGRFVKEEHLLEAVRRLGFLKGTPSPVQNLALSGTLCLFVSMAQFQFLLPMLRLAEMHPVVLLLDFFYMLQVAVMAKIIIKATSISFKKKVD